MRGVDVRSRKAPLVEQRPVFPGFGECGCLGEYLAMMRAAFASN